MGLRVLFFPAGIVERTEADSKNTPKFEEQLHKFANFVRPTMTTSSTAKGGGGSFKNRKPMGRVGCCDSQMAERIH